MDIFLDLIFVQYKKFVDSPGYGADGLATIPRTKIVGPLSSSYDGKPISGKLQYDVLHCVARNFELRDAGQKVGGKIGVFHVASITYV